MITADWKGTFELGGIRSTVKMSFTDETLSEVREAIAEYVQTREDKGYQLIFNEVTKITTK